MGVRERKVRERQEREGRIVTGARAIAEEEGWAAVTIRRLADEIEYSPPVLYGHFPGGRDDIVNAVVLEGFHDFTRVMRAAVEGAQGRDRLRVVVEAYRGFAADNPATYEAMFSMRSGLKFAHESTPPVLREGFGLLVSVVDDGRGDADARAEVFWSALHGMCVLAAAGRLPAAGERARVDALCELFG
ncbi:TetR/AcrR family transcriptional regulator [Rhodococcus sp. D2-41]|uniref:TetR/AcrR family transcriptional regulator n=1 Tax=Speluncibacter jeojiensis TaxID=2710754 RepID=A0A9X4RDE3_9ACTN|nr:TetR/AcrR family transcriptional regulator [Rhodococcus sp. D2-41]MDG3010343.1 TetR/AcrR family transcriptional regulator [Rhodococcus sp. D2-41]MDG3014077.1 TetR/AcrR family transcriptional regulator [Corynebacteriales bacterium D3-21]